MRRIALVPLAVLGLLGAVLGQAAVPAATDSDRAAIQALLDRRAGALLAGDRAGFMSTVSRDSRAFRRRQQDFFDRVSRLPLATYRLRVAWERYGDLVRPADRERYEGADDVSIPLTEERYRIRGFDRAPSVEEVYFTFVRRGGEWLIASDTDLDDLALLSSRHLWDFGPVETTKSEHFLLVFHPCSAGGECDPGRLLAAAEDGLDRVDTYWGASWRRRVVVLVPQTSEELTRILQATFDVDDFVAFAFSTVDVRHDFDLGGHRIILNPGAFRGRSASSSLGILAHELLHVATREISGAFVPNFIEEGLAEYVGRGHGFGALSFFNADVAAGHFDGRLPANYEFLVGDGISIYRQYQKSLSAIKFLVDRWGANKLEELYLFLGSKGVEAGTAGYWVNRAFQKMLGISLREFERRWADSIG